MKAVSHKELGRLVSVQAQVTRCHVLAIDAATKLSV